MANLGDIHINPANPRFIKDEKFEKLCESIKKFPKMLELRPIIIDSTGLILGGNMRFRALKELGWELEPKWFKEADNLTDEEKKRFIVEDNMDFGEWDFDVLSSLYNTDELMELGFNEKDLQLEDNSNQIADDTDDSSNEKDEEIECPNCHHKFKK